jgi:hypothetical protein
MQIKLEWLKPIVLKEGTKEAPFIYTCDEKLLPEEPGIYVFTRRHGKTFTPLYIGQTVNLRSRIKEQFNNLLLMKGIKKAQTGTRMLMIAKLKPAKGRPKDTQKTLHIIEKAYINNALTQGCDLLNVKGTKTPVHNIESTPARKFHQPFLGKMHIKMG